MILRFNIPDDQIPLVVDALCFLRGYSDTLPDGSNNPITKNQFAKDCIVQFIQESVRKYKTQLYTNDMLTNVESAVASASITAL